MLNKQFTCSIVIYKNDLNTLNKTVECVINSHDIARLFLIDNSPTNTLKDHFKNAKITYIFVGKNIGFGSAHNLVLDKIKNYNHHLVLNPDVYFKPEVVKNLITVLNNNNELALVAPKVLYPDNSYQISCRKYPTLFQLILRRLNIKNSSYYTSKELAQPIYVDFFHGSFLLFKTKYLIKINGFDERYLMYMEDVDICRKLDLINKRKLYYPQEEIIHKFEKGSAKKIKLLFYHIKSIFQYFYKWKIAN